MIEKKYIFALTEGRKIWQNGDNENERFTDLNFNFTRPLNPTEQHTAIAHFVEGLSRLGVTDKYAIFTINFADPTILQVTLQSLALDRSRSLLRLIVEFRQKFPVQPPQKLVDILEV